MAIQPFRNGKLKDKRSNAMKKNLLHAFEKLNSSYRKHKGWRWTVRVMALVVVFCTTYMLILPALTMQSGDAICGLEEHVHGAACIGEDGLICGCAQHIHTAECYSVEKENSGVLLCGSGVHTHGAMCYDSNGKCICTIPEHKHEAGCYIKDIDPEADKEVYSDWLKIKEGITLTGDWRRDVILVAKSQLAYGESQKNVILKDDKIKGYTRYGDRYGDPYGDWNKYFTAFVLQYSDVNLLPLDSSLDNWIEIFKSENNFIKREQAPVPGDIVFFGKQTANGTTANRVAIVTEVIYTDNSEDTRIKVIEGDVEGIVTNVTYKQNEAVIMGYGRLPSDGKVSLTYKGSDFRVTVEFGREAEIPLDAVLKVRELEKGSDEYNEHYDDSIKALLDYNPEMTVEELDISFARFFDIYFEVDGKETEPKARVDIQISYDEKVKKDEGKDGIAVHFSSEGIEIKDADTVGENVDSDKEIDTFKFNQNSFSVVGTMVTSSRALTQSGTVVDFNSLNASQGVYYIIYTEYNGRYYAVTYSDTTKKYGIGQEITVNGSTVTWNSGDSSIYWNFERNGYGGSYFISNFANGKYIHAFDNSYGGNQDYGSMTTGRNSSQLTAKENGTFIIRGNNYYTGIQNSGGQIKFERVSGEANAAKFKLALVGTVYNVWFDGTCGGMMSYYGADNLNLPASAGTGGNVVVTLPETWKSTYKYPYKLKGWYDINNHVYYLVDPDDETPVTATINGNTVFYADWIAESYDIGVNNEHVVESVDTNSFITTYVFDYSVLFNVMSQTHTGSITSATHQETWTMQNGGTKVPYKNMNSLYFAFVDYDAGGDFSYANNRGTINSNQSDKITANIISQVNGWSGQNLLDLLFNPTTDVIGKHYVGEGNYLFQYMDSSTSNYDGIHNGYYYLDARLNAASYNQSEQRFYLYDYLERTSDSNKDGYLNVAGQYSDFLPFNSPYIFKPDQLDNYVDSVLRPGYEYDAKDGAGSYQEYNSADDATTNYFFGIRTDIEFFLPNDTNTRDEFGNYGNISTRGEHMVFDFHGDDDVWVFVDGKLLLDIGGLHGIMYGNIDFSSGVITVGRDGGEVQKINFFLEEGTHEMTVYYMERGSSQSNCAIYFNIAPRYSLEITKEDIATVEKLNGAEFTIYNDKALTKPAQLWDSEQAYHNDIADGVISDSKSTFKVVDGVARCWGISAGKTYYIKETSPPPGYPPTDDLIRITLNNRGTATIETTTIHGPAATEGFAVIKQNINETLKIVALTVTNQKVGETTEVRIEKEWHPSSVNIPNSIQVFLLADGEPFGRIATLSEENGWSYTWTGLPKYRSDDDTVEIVYEVKEVLVPNFNTDVISSQIVTNSVDWIKTHQMSDGNTFILVHNGKAYTYNGTAFGWMDPEEAKKDTSTSAHWSIETYNDGFRLKNELGYILTFNPSTKKIYATKDTHSGGNALNQVIYYLNSRLVFHDHDVYYQMGENQNSVSEDGLAFDLHRKIEFTGLLTGIMNIPVDEEDQTRVEVTKKWDNGYGMHVEDYVVISLYADGVDTGHDVILNAANNWTGGFYDLPYYKADGVTRIVYTVVEDQFVGYLPFYSDGTTVPGLPVTIWHNTDSIVASNKYRFASASYYLAIDGSGNVVSVLGNLEDDAQQWEAVQSGSKLVLRNVKTGAYLYNSGTTLTTTASASSAAAISFSGGKLKIGNYYLELKTGTLGLTSNNANATVLTAAKSVDTHGMEGVSYVVTNASIIPPLPNTGGVTVMSITTAGGLLLAIDAVLSLFTFIKRKEVTRKDK